MEKSIKSNYFINLLLSGINIIFPIFTFSYAANLFSPSGVGSIEFGNSIIQFFIILSNFGIPLYGLRVCSKLRNNVVELVKNVQEIFLINIILISIAYLLFLIFLFLFISDSANFFIFFILGLNIIFSNLGLEWLFQSLENFKQLLFTNFSIKSVTLFLIIIFIKNASDIYIYLLILVFSNLIIHTYNFYKINKLLNLSTINSNLNLIRHLKSLVYFFLFTLVVNFYISFDKVLLGIFSTTYSVGIYSASYKLIKLIVVVITSYSTVVIPRLSSFFSKNDNLSVKKVLYDSINFIMMLAIPATVGSFLLAEPITLIIFGQQFREAIFTQQILSPLIIVISISNFIGLQLLLPQGRELLLLITTFLASIISVTFNILLSPIFYHNGTAISSLLSEVFVTIVLLVFTFKQIVQLINLKILFTYIISSALIYFTILIISTFGLDNLIFIISSFSSSLLIYTLSLLKFKNYIMINLFRTIIIYVKAMLL
jgi:O-antigen/teichoic acid export membrane protein